MCSVYFWEDAKWHGTRVPEGGRMEWTNVSRLKTIKFQCVKQQEMSWRMLGEGVERRWIKWDQSTIVHSDYSQSRHQGGDANIIAAVIRSKRSHRVYSFRYIVCIYQSTIKNRTEVRSSTKSRTLHTQSHELAMLRYMTESLSKYALILSDGKSILISKILLND